MKISSILIIALAAGSLAAQDAAKLDGRIQVFAELYRPAQIVVAQSPGDIKDQPSRQTGVGFRLLGELPSHAGFYYELGGMFDGSSNFKINNAGVIDLTDVKVTDSYWCLGAAYMGAVGEHLTLGAHLEARGEYLRIQGQAIVNSSAVQVDSSTTYLRPWVRGSADYTFTGIGKENHPYIGIEAAFAITKTSQTQPPTFGSVDNRTLDSLAPRASAALYAGIRF
ncbi:MAG: hypothetical protein P4L36_16685 [Holophaga sp.]|nr:hypothetical protein [Holophaga sp.]